MADDELPRRRLLAGAGAAVTTALAGCAAGPGDDAAPTTDATATDAADPTAAGTTAGTGGSTTDAGTDPSGAYEVTMAPMGPTTFETVPEEWVAYKTGYGDMGIALGQAEGLAGIDRPGESLALLNDRFYSQLGLDLSFEDVTNVRGGESIDKEVFYEIDADLHLMDPNLPEVYFDWSEADVTEIEERVAPFFGSFVRRARDESWGESYEFYTLYEAFEKVAAVFRERERYEALAAVHDEMLGTVESALPPEDERPSIALLNGGSNPAEGTFYAMDPTAKGYEMKQYRDLGIRDAFAGVETGEFGETDWEGLLAVDPEIVVFHWGVTYPAEQFRERFVAPMEESEFADDLTAVREGNLYPGGTAEQGPIVNLFQTEMLAQQQYPDRFGAFPGLGETPEEPLFDRERVADVVRGEL
jgi:iron complex transport system substrate-binding protein